MAAQLKKEVINDNSLLAIIIVSISSGIGNYIAFIINNKFKKYNSVLELGEDGASVKKKAKSIEGSTFLENRRKSPTK